VEFIEDDWRNMRDTYDVFVSVGMLEHVGRKNYRRLSDVIDRCLKPNGIGLIHSIGQNFSQPFNSWVERRIFPGAYPPTIREMMDIFEPHDLSVLDVENLRLHYAKTLRHWLKRFERSSDVVRDKFGERFVRMWRLYLAGSVAAFESGSMQLFQILFARGTNNQIPWTRDDLYCNRTVVPTSRTSDPWKHTMS
jgi:cyclopropane-fatty-acyl-phospholipid synthase